MNKKLLVIGDIILDEYIEGYYAKRVSDEGKHIFLEKSVTYIAGGAGNVASNMVQAGIPTTLIGVIGTDKASLCCSNILKKNGVDLSMALVEQNWKIPVKTRYMVQNQQVFRSDKEQTFTIQKSTECLIMNHLSKHIQEFSSIVIVDYQAGVLTPNLVQEILHLACQYGKRVISDSKAPCLLPFKGCYLLKMNHKELGIVVKRKCDSLEDIKTAAIQILKQCQCRYLLITWGKNGLILLSNDFFIQCTSNHLSVSPAVCTIGAGDVLTAYLLAGIENNLSVGQCMALANNAAEMAVSMPMTTVLHISLSELKCLQQLNRFSILTDSVGNGGNEHDQNSAWNQYWT